MVKELLWSLPTDELVTFVGLEPELYGSKHSIASSDLLRNALQILAGDRTWESVIASELNAGSFDVALKCFVSASSKDILIGPKVVAEISNRYKEIAEENLKFVTKVDQRLVKFLSDQCGDSDIRVLALELKDYRDALEIQGSVPRNLVELQAFHKEKSDLHKIGEYLDIIDEFSRMQSNNDITGSFEIGKTAWDRIQRDYINEAAERKNLEIIFQKIPLLVLNGNTSLLKQISDDNVDIFFIINQMKELPTFNYPPVSIHSYTNHKAGFQQDESILGNLDGASKTLIEQTKSLGHRLESDIDDMIKEARKLNSFQQKRGALFLIGKSTDILDQKYISYGEGLICEALHELTTEEMPRYASRYLKDALTMLVNCKLDIELQLSYKASYLIVLTKVIQNPRLKIKLKAYNIYKYIDPCKAFFEDFEGDEVYEIIATEWSSLENDASATVFLSYFEPLVSNQERLLTLMADSLLRPVFFMKDPEGTLLKLIQMLPQTSNFDQIFTLAEELTNNLLEFYENPLPRVKSEVLKITNNLTEILSMDHCRSLAPCGKIIVELPDIIKVILGGSVEKESSVLMQPLVSIIYPDERHCELEIPILLKHQGGSSPLSDIKVKFGVKDLPADLKVKLIDYDFFVGNLFPQEESEIRLCLDIPKDSASRITSIKFYIEIDMEVLHLRTNKRERKTEQRNFTVNIRPGNRKFADSPYSTGVAVRGPSFLGREDEIQRLVNAMTGKSQQRAVLVFGNRRIGKTSLILKLETHEEITRHYFFKIWDIEDKPYTLSSVDFLYQMCLKIWDAVPKKYHDQIKIRKDEFVDDPYFATEKFIEKVEIANIPKRILFVIDEFDKLLNIIDNVQNEMNISPSFGPSEVLQKEVLGSIRKILMFSQKVSIVICGLPNIKNTKYDDRLFGLFELVEVGPFSEKEGKKLLGLSDHVFEITPDARMKLFKASGLQPYLLQLLCHNLFIMMITSGRDKATSEDITDIIERLILPNEKNFTDIVSLIDKHKEVLTALAKTLQKVKKSREFATIKEIREVLVRDGYNHDDNQIKEALEYYFVDAQRATSGKERPLVFKTANHRYRFIVGLLSEHLALRSCE